MRSDSQRCFVVVCYDVVSDGRRARLHKKLKNYGQAVQYSVFECLVDDKTLQRMKSSVRDIVDPKTDTVRYYLLCKICSGHARRHNGEIVEARRTIVV